MEKTHYNYDELIQCAQGNLFGSSGPQLPMPPMLMISEIIHISDNGGDYNKGHLEAKFQLSPDLWFFECHFIGDPVMPGCLGLDALWQLVGFYLGTLGYKGKGRALGLQQLKFNDQILNTHAYIQYKLHFKRIIPMKEFVMGIADGYVYIGQSEKPVYQALGLRVGLFASQNRGENS